MTLSRRSPLVALGLLASVSSAAYVAHEIASVAAASHVRSVLAHTPGVSATSVSADAWTGRVTIEGLAAGGISVGRLSLVSPEAQLLPAFIAPAFALDGSATAENIVIDLGFMKYMTSKIDASGTTMSSGDLTDLFNTKSSTPIADRLAKFTAASVTAADISAESSMAGSSQSVTYHDLKMVNVVKGKIGAMSMAGGNQSATMADGQKMEITFGAMSGKGIDLAAMARFLTATRTDDNEPLAMVQESFSVDGYSIDLVGSGVSVKMGTMTGRDLKMRPLKTPFREFIAMAGDKKRMENPEPEQITKMLGTSLDMFSSFEFGLLEARDLVITMPPGEKVNSVKLRRFGISGWGNGKIGEYAFEGFELDAPDGHAKLGQFALRGFNYKDALAAVTEQLAEGLESFAEADPRKFIPTLDQIAISGMDLDVPDDKGKGNSADGKRITMALGKFEMNGSGYLGGVPTSLNATLDNFTFDIANSKDDQLKDFIAMGFKKFDLSARMDMAWNEAAETLSIRQLTGKSGGMGTISVKGTIGNVAKELFTGDQAAIEAAVLGVLFKDVDLRFENGGIVEKALEQQAKKMKKTPDALKKEGIGMASSGIPALLQNAPAAKDIAAAVVKFIASPKSLHFAAKSADGLGVADLGLLNDPVALIKKLSIVASAND